MRYDKLAMWSGVLAMIGALALPSSAQDTAAPPISSESKSIFEAMDGSADHRTLSVAAQAAALNEHFSISGPVTFFAPTDRAFEGMPRGLREPLLKPENRERLRKVLAYHVVPGRMTTADLIGAVRERGGSATLRTISGASLRVRIVGDELQITDYDGGRATILGGDNLHPGGVIHVIDAVLIPQDLERGFSRFR